MILEKNSSAFELKKKIISTDAFPCWSKCPHTEGRAK